MFKAAQIVVEKSVESVESVILPSEQKNFGVDIIFMPNE